MCADLCGPLNPFGAAHEGEFPEVIPMPQAERGVIPGRVSVPANKSPGRYMNTLGLSHSLMICSSLGISVGEFPGRLERYERPC